LRLTAFVFAVHNARVPTHSRPTRDRLAFPLDASSLEEASGWIDRLAPHVGVMKVGLELFIGAGPAAVDRVHRARAACFLDLKLHDIPATMAGAAKRAASLGVRYLTVHASAGPRALGEVVRATEGSETRVLAVTVLTSMDRAELAAVGHERSLAALVVDLGRLARDAGAHGLVCSPEEVSALRAALGEEIELVVPGIRPFGAAAGDQKRIATPEQAIAAGADVLVVGRPIREAADPIAAAVDVLAAIERAS
jgi:orotidine-5'-phosphate decarboxylase